MKKINATLCCIYCLCLAGCIGGLAKNVGMTDKEMIGTGAGAAAGGTIGHVLGRKNPVWTVAGAIVGAFTGHALTTTEEKEPAEGDVQDVQLQKAQ